MGNARTILLVDDDIAERTRLEELLVDMGHAVATASTGEDAIWMLDNGPCDAVFTSIALRGMSGIELIGEVSARKRKLPIIVMASDKSKVIRDQAIAAGATEFVAKPLSSERVTDILARALATVAPAAAATQSATVDAVPATTMSEPITRLKNIILFLLAPFVGLVYLLSFPIVGMGMLIWTTLAWKKRKAEESGELQPAKPAARGVVKSIAMIPGALVLGVAFAVIGPILGVGVLLWFSFHAWGKIGAKALAS